MPNFLSLPRELRDQIYQNVLAPNGFITLIPHRESAIRRGCAPVTILSQAIYNRSIPISQEKISKNRIELSLLRTCRQIFIECHEILFKENIWFFRDARGLELVLGEMGQKQSRRIEKMIVDFTKGLGTICSPRTRPGQDLMSNIFTAEKIKSLGKVLRKSLSRARQGSLRELGIRIDGSGIINLAGAKHARFEQFLKMGRDIDDWGKLHRSVDIWISDEQRQVFDRVARRYNLDEYQLDFIMMKIHFAWGGKMLLNGQLIWQDFGRVAEIPVIAKSAWTILEERPEDLN